MTVSRIDSIRRQAWPANRANGDFWQELKSQQDMEPRKVICGRCGWESGMLTGPEGRAAFGSHRCGGPNLRLVKS